MTQMVHIANTDVEFEYAHASLMPLEQSWSQHPLCLQLQFLPLLYAQPNDLVAVSALPSQDYFVALQQTGWWQNGLPHVVPLHLVTPFQGAYCLSWGPSRQVQAWAQARQMHYDLPSDWSLICLINSKSFSFRYTCLPEAALLYHEKELLSWLSHVKGPKVIKTCFGLSAKGNWRIDGSIPSSEFLAVCHKEWQQKRPLIGEPWLDRLYDFSTQWYIHSDKHIERLGTTRFETNSHGTYQGTLVGPEEMLFTAQNSFLEQHKKFALKALQDIAAMGFFGFIGVDALIYRCQKTSAPCLYPLVEINARQTMSLVALRLQQRLCPQQILHLTFLPSSSSFSLLPQQLSNFKGKIITFRRHLTLTILPEISEIIPSI